MIRSIGLISAVLFTSACSSDSNVDIGSGRTGERLSDYAASWSGYAEGYQFRDGKDDVRLWLDEEGAGVLEVGDSAALPAAMAGDKPPESPWAPAPRPGVSYPIVGAMVEAQRLRFSVALGEAYRDWCSAQPPVPFEMETFPGVYSCAPRIRELQGGDDGTCLDVDANQTVFCELPPTCHSICSCTAEECSVGGLTAQAAVLGPAGVPPVTLRDPQLDLALLHQGEMLEGTLLIGHDEQERITLRLTRQDP